MNWDENTALRIVRSIVQDGTSVYCPPLQRDLLRKLVRLIEAQQRTIAQYEQAKSVSGGNK